MDTRFVAFSSLEGDIGLFFPPIFPVPFPPMTLLVEVEREGRLAWLPPLIFSANNLRKILLACLPRLTIPKFFLGWFLAKIEVILSCAKQYAVVKCDETHILTP